MKLRSFRPWDAVWCVLLVAVYGILLQVMIHTRAIEKVMAMNSSPVELIAIVMFLVTRILTYLLVPSLAVAAGAYALAWWILGKPGRQKSPADLELKAESQDRG